MLRIWPAPNGEGANLAMLDGSEIGEAIAAHPADLEHALHSYEQTMFARAADAASEDLHDLMLRDEAPYSGIAMMRGDGQDE
jgi:2-polyprenyl-6-methoxyphenol hydroxylase-like FAD-dependent oxidoreductase